MSDDRVTSKKIAGLMVVYSQPKDGGSTTHKAIESYSTTNGVMLAKWDEAHGMGYTTRMVHVPAESIPWLVAILMDRYLRHLKEKAAEVLKQADR
jgi:hypothetical protein